ncbi:hypothetical protein [Nannocystis bainbridge]|uniref:Uncharacterized protein n=1 Tax=Nannocystis bainbridge TaxID=2995303 RepID=A0ABT5E8B7_9BACT|nr:hypothetical protein [Nannocystis bainbridge]MDC0721143.1 hypothetical protein [Nannocystis bainbridge]
MRLVWPLSAAFALFACSARADVIPRPPDDCPPGSEGGAGHCGAHCFALACTSDDECPDGTTCQPAKACIGIVNCFPEPSPVHGGACSPRDTCGGVGETCQTIDLCLPAGETASGGSDTGSTSSGTSSGSSDSGSTSSGSTTSGSTTSTSTTTGSTTSTSSGTSSESTSSTSSSTSNGSTEATPTTGGQPGTTGGSTSSSTASGTGSNTGGGGGGDKAGCAGCGVAEGPQGVFALLVIVGARRRRPRRPVPKVM